MLRSKLYTGVGALGVLALLGCGSYANIDRDLSDHPVTHTGVAAAIILPGDPGIPMGTNVPPRGLGGPPGASRPDGNGSASATGSATGAPSGGGMVMIGGTTQDIEKHQKVNNEPAWAKVLKLPFLVAAYPFRKLQQAVSGPPDPTVAVTGPAPPPAPTPSQRAAQREARLLETMERELSGQAPATPAGVPPLAPAQVAPQATAPSAPSGPSLSIAQELAALRRAMAAPHSATPTPTRTPAMAATPPPERLYESVDRDADGRIDRWIYRQGDQLVAEAVDDDGDGRPERKVRFVPGTREPATEEEDSNGNGRPDTFTEYEGGVVTRRRADTDGDGEIDAWSFYRDGALLRHEHDTNSDGFRDRMSFYEGGRLVREEEDRDGNGRPDRITHFDEHERIAHQEEDTNGDDVMDIRSFYQEGKLRRREIIR